MGGAFYNGRFVLPQTEYRNRKARFGGFGLFSPLQAFAHKRSTDRPPKRALCVLAREARAAVRLLGKRLVRPSTILANKKRAGLQMSPRSNEEGTLNEPLAGRPSPPPVTEEMNGGEGMIRFIAGTSRSGPVTKPVEFPKIRGRSGAHVEFGAHIWNAPTSAPDKVVRLLDGGVRRHKMRQGTENAPRLIRSLTRGTDAEPDDDNSIHSDIAAETYASACCEKPL